MADTLGAQAKPQATPIDGKDRPEMRGTPVPRFLPTIQPGIDLSGGGF